MKSFLLWKCAQSCPTLCNPMDCSLPVSSVRGIFQAIVLEWIAISFSRGSSRSRDRTQVSCIVDRRFTAWATREALFITEEPDRLQSMGSKRVGRDWATSLSLFTFMHRRRKWRPTPVFLPGESQGQESLVGCRLWGRTESDTTEAT